MGHCALPMRKLHSGTVCFCAGLRGRSGHVADWLNYVSGGRIGMEGSKNVKTGAAGRVVFKGVGGAGKMGVRGTGEPARKGRTNDACVGMWRME